MKISFSVLVLGTFGTLSMSLGYWIWTVIHTFPVPEPWLGSLLYYLHHTVSEPKLRPILFWSLLKGFAPMLIILYVMKEIRADEGNVNLLRGARIVSTNELVRKTRAKSPQLQVEIAGVPIPVACESGHLLLTGSTNTGKTTAADEVLHFALERGDRIIVIDPNGHAFSQFGKKEDVLMNPFDTRSPGWSIFNELRNPFDVDRLAKSVIPDSSDSSAQQWHEYARLLFAETTRALTRCGDTNTGRLLYFLTNAPTDELNALLAGSAATGLFTQGAERALASTRFVLTHHVGAFQFLNPGTFSLRDWLDSGNGNLYLTWREDMITTLRPLISIWTNILISSILTLPTAQPRTIWLSLDELASLDRLSSLEAGLTKGRKHGLRIIACLQSVSQLNELYGTHTSNTLRSCFRNLLALGCSNADPYTAKEISDGLGQCEIERSQTTISNSKSGQSSTTSMQRTLELAVLPSELMALPPLRGFLKIAGNYPIGRVRLIPKNHPVISSPFVER